VEPWRPKQLAHGPSSAEVIEQATLGRRQDESEIVEGQGQHDRHAGDQL
jgi:hypothetical protein